MPRASFSSKASASPYHLRSPRRCSPSPVVVVACGYQFRLVNLRVLKPVAAAHFFPSPTLIEFELPIRINVKRCLRRTYSILEPTMVSDLPTTGLLQHTSAPINITQQETGPTNNATDVNTSPSPPVTTVPTATAQSRYVKEVNRSKCYTLTLNYTAATRQTGRSGTCYGPGCRYRS